MSDELVQRLRARADDLRCHPLANSIADTEGDGELMADAFAEIERLTLDWVREQGERTSAELARDQALLEIERLRAEVGKLRVQRAGEDVRLADAISERDRLRAEVATIRNLQTVAESALAALRKRIDEAPVTTYDWTGHARRLWATLKYHDSDTTLIGKRVALVLLEE